MCAGWNKIYFKKIDGSIALESLVASNKGIKEFAANFTVLPIIAHIISVLVRTTEYTVNPWARQPWEV